MNTRKTRMGVSLLGSLAEQAIKIKSKFILALAGLAISSHASAVVYEVVFDLTFNSNYSYVTKSQVEGFVPFTAQATVLMDDTLVSSNYSSGNGRTTQTLYYNPPTLFSPVTNLLPWNGVTPPTTFSSPLIQYDTWRYSPPQSGGEVWFAQEANTPSGLYYSQLNIRNYNPGTDLHTRLMRSMLENSTVYFGERLTQSAYGIIVGGESFGATGHIISVAPYTAPVPEPESYLMILTGLALVSFARARQKMLG